mmetsp:Transcript_120827/g.352987  ORF Transcript_120827/g.352987 Transcript_120827/m.352987 type:complete len:207 (+) Transcript_120827:519-1139(+)
MRWQRSAHCAAAVFGRDTASHPAYRVSGNYAPGSHGSWRHCHPAVPLAHPCSWRPYGERCCAASASNCDAAERHYSDDGSYYAVGESRSAASGRSYEACGGNSASCSSPCRRGSRERVCTPEAQVCECYASASDIPPAPTCRHEGCHHPCPPRHLEAVGCFPLGESLSSLHPGQRHLVRQPRYSEALPSPVQQPNYCCHWQAPLEK